MRHFQPPKDARQGRRAASFFVSQRPCGCSVMQRCRPYARSRAAHASTCTARRLAARCSCTARPAPPRAASAGRSVAAVPKTSFMTWRPYLIQPGNFRRKRGLLSVPAGKRVLDPIRRCSLGTRSRFAGRSRTLVGCHQAADLDKVSPLATEQRPQRVHRGRGALTFVSVAVAVVVAVVSHGSGHPVPGPVVLQSAPR